MRFKLNTDIVIGSTLFKKGSILVYAADDMKKRDLGEKLKTIRDNYDTTIKTFLNDLKVDSEQDIPFEVVKETIEDIQEVNNLLKVIEKSFKSISDKVKTQEKEVSKEETKDIRDQFGKGGKPIFTTSEDMMIGGVLVKAGSVIQVAYRELIVDNTQTGWSPHDASDEELENDIEEASVIDFQKLQITPKGSVEEAEKESSTKIAMKLLTKAIEKQIPALYEQDGLGKDAIAYVKFFTPWSNWTWYGTEYDPKTKEFFGLVDGLDSELGYFSLTELESITGPGGLKIERDLHFSPTKLRNLK